MNVTPSTQKMIVSLAIVLLLGYIVYSTLTVEVSGTVGLDGQTIEAPVGQDILILSDKLESVNINKEVFSSEVFRSLVDISVQVSTESKGRVNPFAEIGNDGSTLSTNLSTTTRR
mgnify:CR=1 FL=1|jgi:hypothetical protein